MSDNKNSAKQTEGTWTGMSSAVKLEIARLLDSIDPENVIFIDPDREYQEITKTGKEIE